MTVNVEFEIEPTEHENETTELSSSAQVLKAIQEIHERTSNIIMPYV